MGEAAEFAGLVGGEGLTKRLLNSVDKISEARSFYGGEFETREGGESSR